VTDLAKGLWMRHTDMRVAKLIEYAKRLNVGSISRRLGYLLELFAIATEAEPQPLRNTLTATYVPLDPSVTSEGSHIAKWRLRLNIPPDELLAARST
jgi:predicted transcriptional regulator of viral defense system